MKRTKGLPQNELYLNAQACDALYDAVQRIAAAGDAEAIEITYNPYTWELNLSTDRSSETIVAPQNHYPPEFSVELSPAVLLTKTKDCPCVIKL